MDTEISPAPKRFLPSYLWSAQYLMQVPGNMDHAMDTNQEKIAELFAISVPPASAPIIISSDPTPSSTTLSQHIFWVSAPPILPYDENALNLRTFAPNS